MSTTPTNFVGTATEAQRVIETSSQFRAMALAITSGLRVAMPGVIASFDSTKQTCTVDVAVQDRIKLNGVVSDKKIPTLLDVPIVIPRGGGFSLTLPCKPGDECLVVFADMCIDSWYDAGGINNVINRLRRHDFSDAFAILGPYSQPRTLADYSTTGAALRSDDGLVSVGIEASGVTVTAPAIELDGPTTVDGPLTIEGLLKIIGGATVPSVSPATLSYPITINGVTVYLKLSTSP